MWKDYSVGFIRNNRASSISIMVAAFISSLFLSFLCSMFYNVWVYEVEKDCFGGRGLAGQAHRSNGCGGLTHNREFC